MVDQYSGLDVETHGLDCIRGATVSKLNAGCGAGWRRTQQMVGRALMALLVGAVAATGALAQDSRGDFDPNLLLADDAAAASDAGVRPRQVGANQEGRATSNGDQPALAPLRGELADYLAESTAEWSMAPGETVQGVLNRWAEYAGWSIVWDATRDYPVRASLSFARGTSFPDAVREVMKAVYRHNPTLKATVYRNKVVVITDDGSEALQ